MRHRDVLPGGDGRPPAELQVGVSTDTEIGAVHVRVPDVKSVATLPDMPMAKVEIVVGTYRAQDQMCPAFCVAQHARNPVERYAGVGVGVREPDLTAW